MPKKIFEIAKELDMGAIDLVEKLKAEGFNVRNHMASLDDSEVEQVMAKFGAGAGDASAEKKTTKKKVVKKSAKKKTTKKKAVVTKKKTVIRRKGDSDSEEETVAEVVVEAAAEAPATETPVTVEAEKPKKTRIVKKDSKKKADSTPSEEASENKSESLKEAFGLRVVSRPEEEEAGSARAGSDAIDSDSTSEKSRKTTKEGK